MRRHDGAHRSRHHALILCGLLAMVCAWALPRQGTAQTARAAPATPREATPALLDVLRSHRVVSFPGGHTDGNAVHAAFFRTVREVNAMRPAEKRIRVLLGDPPIDSDNIRGASDYSKWVIQRDSY